MSQMTEAQKLFEEASGALNDAGNPRVKQLILRILQDTARLIEDMSVTPDEF